LINDDVDYRNKYSELKMVMHIQSHLLLAAQKNIWIKCSWRCQDYIGGVSNMESFYPWLPPGLTA
jgi:hypothetical protein